MKVFAIYTHESSDLLRLWVESWTRRGWQPQLVSPRELETQTRRAAVKKRGGKVLVSLTQINFSMKHMRDRRQWKNYGAPGWEKAPVVTFPAGTTEYQVLNCGRSL